MCAVENRWVLSPPDTKDTHTAEDLPIVRDDQRRGSPSHACGHGVFASWRSAMPGVNHEWRWNRVMMFQASSGVSAYEIRSRCSSAITPSSARN
jgi:hypothetical protein